MSSASRWQDENSKMKFQRTIFCASQMTYPGNASRTPQLEEYTAAQAGQTATYWLRWVSTRGDKGPWSEPVSATIPG
jgi:hypothetical protein